MRVRDQILKQTVGVIFILLFVTTLACGSGQQAQPEEQSAMSEMKEYTIEQKDAAVAKAQEMMEDLDKKIESWEMKMDQKWDDLKETSRENYAKSKEELKNQRADMAAWLEKMQNSSGEAWEEVTQGFVDGYDAFVESWNKAEMADEKEM